jgi:ApaG protein
MIAEITQGIKVTVETEYQPSYSSPSQYHYVFTYRITIENQSDFTIQLLRRHWHIHDAGFITREVEGEGVVGQQPVLEPGQSHQYVSGCNLKSGLVKWPARTAWNVW